MDVFFIYFILASIILYYVFSSLVILRRVKLMARVRFEPIDEEIFFADRNYQFKDMDREIRSLNFDYVASSSFDNSSIELVKKGYCRRKIDPDGRRSLTLKGACLMTWKLLFPGRQIQNLIESIDRKRLLSTLESF